MDLRNILTCANAIIFFVFCGRFLTEAALSEYDKIRGQFPKPDAGDASKWRIPETNDYHKEDHPCKRHCVANQPMTCYYYMVAHYDKTLGSACDFYLKPNNVFPLDNKEYIDSRKISKYRNETHDDCKYADGVETELILVNGQYPGDVIEVCQGDTIVADLINSLREPTTLHWHGMHQRQAPHMDGVPHITQYPVEPGQAYRYRFEVDHEGTNWWHSHTNTQRESGMAGALIVRQPPGDNVHVRLYDYDLTEHTVMLQDWRFNEELAVAENLLINGLGRNINLDAKHPKRPTFYADFKVFQGARYRFRVIFNGVTNCPITFSIDQHKLDVISSDGNDIEPLTVDSLVLNAGERYDFVLQANQPIQNYWMRVKGHNFCDMRQVHQEAILHYQGADAYKLPGGQPLSHGYERDGLQLNPINKVPTNDGSHLTVIDMTAKTSGSRIAVGARNPSYVYYSAMAVESGSDGFRFQMDGISFSMPKVSLLQSRNLGIGGFFCNKTQQEADGVNCRSSHCRCSNVIHVPAFKYVEFVVSSITSTSHPIHLHGYTFHVVGMGVLDENRIRDIEEIDRKSPLPRRTVGAPLKDTVQVPAYGYTILRFYTDSPGYWLLHCHISPHSENGMAAVVRVGEDVEMKMCPVSNCGLCSSSL